jgi:hypothetical protein
MSVIDYGSIEEGAVDLVNHIAADVERIRRRGARVPAFDIKVLSLIRRRVDRALFAADPTRALAQLKAEVLRREGEAMTEAMRGDLADLSFEQSKNRLAAARAKLDAAKSGPKPKKAPGRRPGRA